MTHIEFIEKLKTIPLKHEDYKKLGLEDDYIINGIIKRYTLVNRREGGQRLVIKDDPIVLLINEFDLSWLVISMISFNEELEVSNDLIFFAKFEVDDLAINRVTNEIILVAESTEEIMYYCASNSAAFLEALIFIGAFLQKRSVDEFLYEDENANISIAEECSELAGGEKYFSFYRMMLGI
jgi:hypothetical protein